MWLFVVSVLWGRAVTGMNIHAHDYENTSVSEPETNNIFEPIGDDPIHPQPPSDRSGSITYQNAIGIREQLCYQASNTGTWFGNVPNQKHIDDNDRGGQLTWQQRIIAQLDQFDEQLDASHQWIKDMLALTR